VQEMYLMNNTIIGDHRGLFIYIDVGYSGLYHDVIILCTLDLHKIDIIFVCMRMNTLSTYWDI
jgi:hypothetical protein